MSNSFANLIPGAVASCLHGCGDKSSAAGDILFMARKRQGQIWEVHKESRLSFIRQTVFYEIRNGKVIRPKALYKCICGNLVEKVIDAVKRGSTKSCGCLNTESIIKRRRTHGLSGTPIYDLWATVKNRCYNVNEPSYPEYGGRGVIMCDEWKNDPAAFVEWAKKNGWKKGLQIDKDIIAMKLRLEPLLYSPDRCQFVTAKTNGTATRKSRYIEYNGVTKTLAQWSDELGIGRSTILLRLDVYGYSIEKALTKGWRGRKNK